MVNFRWSGDTTFFKRAMNEIVFAGPDTFVLVNSRPRSGSKFLHGALIAAFGALSGAKPSVENGFLVNPGHTHGLSDRRMASHSSDKRAVQEEHKRIFKERLNSARRSIVFTTLRDEESRLFSAFVVQKASIIERSGVSEIDEEFARFRLNNSIDDWIEDEVTGIFSIPPFGPTAFEEPLAIEQGGLIYVTLPLAKAERFVVDYLFPVVSREAIEERGRALNLQYGLHNRNSSSSRGLDYVHRKAAYILGAGGLEVS